MNIEFVKLSRVARPPVFMVWDMESAQFEEHNGQRQWERWSDFESDMKLSMRHQGHDVGKRLPGRGDEILDKYLAAAPIYVKRIGAPPEPPTPKYKEFLYNLRLWAILAGIGFFLLYTLWAEFIKPTLGSYGLIEYKTPAEVRYEAFLDKASQCKEVRKVFTEKSSKFPTLHTFNCAEGEELVWAYKIERATKVQNGKWLLE